MWCHGAAPKIWASASYFLGSAPEGAQGLHWEQRGFGSKGPWLVPLCSPQQKSHLKQINIFEHLLKNECTFPVQALSVCFLMFKIAPNQQLTRAMNGILATEDDY